MPKQRQRAALPAERGCRGGGAVVSGPGLQPEDGHAPARPGEAGSLQTGWPSRPSPPAINLPACQLSWAHPSRACCALEAPRAGLSRAHVPGTARCWSLSGTARWCWPGARAAPATASWSPSGEPRPWPTCGPTCRCAPATRAGQAMLRVQARPVLAAAARACCWWLARKPRKGLAWHRSGLQPRQRTACLIVRPQTWIWRLSCDHTCSRSTSHQQQGSADSAAVGASPNPTVAAASLPQRPPPVSRWCRCGQRAWATQRPTSPPKGWAPWPASGAPERPSTPASSSPGRSTGSGHVSPNPPLAWCLSLSSAHPHCRVHKVTLQRDALKASWRPGSRPAE